MSSDSKKSTTRYATPDELDDRFTKSGRLYGGRTSTSARTTFAAEGLSTCLAAAAGAPRIGIGAAIANEDARTRGVRTAHCPWRRRTTPRVPAGAPGSWGRGNERQSRSLLRRKRGNLGGHSSCARRCGEDQRLMVRASRRSRRTRSFPQARVLREGRRHRCPTLRPGAGARRTSHSEVVHRASS